MTDQYLSFDPPKKVTPKDLTPGDHIDLTPLYDVAEIPADDGDRMVADSELAVVYTVTESGPWKTNPSIRLWTIETSLTDMDVPATQTIDVHGHETL